VFLNAHLDGGLLDPNVRPALFGRGLAFFWNLVLEAAVKVPIDGQRDLLSTGHTTSACRRRCSASPDRHAAYLSAAAVRTQGSVLTGNDRTQIVPTYIFGYEYSYSEKTNIVAQYYVKPERVHARGQPICPGCSRQVSDIARPAPSRRASVWTFAITENMRNFEQHARHRFQIAGPTARRSCVDLRRGNQSPIRLSRHAAEGHALAGRLARN